MSFWALVPVKARAESKRRLSPILGDEERTALVRAMLGQVLEALAQCRDIEGISVLSPERDLLPADQELLPDGGRGLNDALEGAIETLARRGAKRVAIVFADLPLVTAEDLSSLLAANSPTTIAIAPDRNASGTNALCLTLPTEFRFRFGPGSLVQHLAEAARVGLKPVPVRRAGLAFDVDEPEDVTLLKAYAAPRYRFLA
ncbi:MAG TPA: 2-phospho-L-lactate guanylyltransferase [Steroidobacteraceae bacterium]|nr:2-phospho-L-lactate guanylyltransferase [Steroidobacteraceae bacterium]